jgi:hypothetical protein
MGYALNLEERSQREMTIIIQTDHSCSRDA